MLKAWLRKRVRVEDMQTQVLDFTVVSHTSDELILVVSDRLSGGVAVGLGDEIALPVHRPDRRRIMMVRRQGTWLVSSVRWGQPRPRRRHHYPRPLCPSPSALHSPDQHIQGIRP